MQKIRKVFELLPPLTSAASQRSGPPGMFPLGGKTDDRSKIIAGLGWFVVGGGKGVVCDTIIFI